MAQIICLDSEVNYVSRRFRLRNGEISLPGIEIHNYL